MSAIVGEPWFPYDPSFHIGVNGGVVGEFSSLIFLYALSLFFFKQRLLMWRIAQLAHELDNFTPDLNVSSSNPTRVTANFQFN